MKRAILVLAGVLIASSAWAGTAYFGGFTGETGTIQFGVNMFTNAGYAGTGASVNGVFANNDGKWTVLSKIGKLNSTIYNVSGIPTGWNRSDVFSVPDIASPVVGEVAYTATFTAKLNSVAVATANGFASNGAIYFRAEPNKMGWSDSKGKGDNTKIGMGVEIASGVWKLRDDLSSQALNAPFELDANAHLIKVVITKTYVAAPAGGLINAEIPAYGVLAGEIYSYAEGTPVPVFKARYYIDGVDKGYWHWGIGAPSIPGDDTMAFCTNQNVTTPGLLGQYKSSDTVVPTSQDATMTAADMADMFVITNRGNAAEWVDPTIIGTNVPDTNTSSIDYDQDGLPSTQEVEIGLNAAVSNINVDTDGDGVKDVNEVQLGLNPLVADSNGDGYSDKVAASLFPSDPSHVILASELPVAGLAGLALLGLGLAAAGVRRVRK